MKTILNWRYYVMAVLFLTGFMAVAFLFSEDSLPLQQWLITRIELAAIAAPCFYALSKLTKKWESEGKIPELTNQTID